MLKIARDITEAKQAEAARGGKASSGWHAKWRVRKHSSRSAPV